MSTHHPLAEDLPPIVKTTPEPIPTKTVHRPRNCARLVLTLEVAVDPSDVTGGRHAVDVLRARLADREGRIELPWGAIHVYLAALDIDADIDLAKVEVSS